MNNLSDSEDTSSAFIDKGFLINNNSDKKESAFKFVKYMLSEDVQCNSEVGLPVNKAAQKKLIEEIDLDSYIWKRIATITILSVIIPML